MELSNERKAILIDKWRGMLYDDRVSVKYLCDNYKKWTLADLAYMLMDNKDVYKYNKNELAELINRYIAIHKWRV